MRGMPRYFYLDQKDWIDIAKLRAGKPDIEHLRAAVKRLAPMVASGDVVVPLSSGHVAETWKITNHRQRRGLALEMTMWSRRFAIAPLASVVDWEFDQVAGELNGSLTHPEPAQVFGVGLDFALGLQRELVMPWSEDTPEYMKAATEFEILAGTLGDGRTAEDEQREVDAQRSANWLTDLSQELARTSDQVGSDQDRIAACVIGMTELSLFHRAIGAGVHRELFQLLTDERPWALVRRMPSLATLTELIRLSYPNVQKPRKATDFYDLRVLAVALPYCDVVSTDGFWADIIRRSAHIGSFGTAVVSGRSGLEDSLQYL